MAKLLATLLVLISATVLTRPAEAIDCPLTRQRAFDSIVDRLRHIVPNPEAVGLQERVCVVAVAIQIVGAYPSGLAALSSSITTDLRAALKTIVPGKSAEEALRTPQTYSMLLSELNKKCTSDLQLTPAKDLSREQAARCGLLQIPGAPRGLGSETARLESGNAIGGYDTVSPDPGAGGLTYGRYQLASKAGGIAGFLAALNCPTGHSPCLHESFRYLGKELQNVGGVAAAQDEKSTFAKKWIELAQNDRGMQQAQEAYQSLETWEPMKEFFAKELGIDLPQMSCGLREAAFSIRTQHSGPSTRQIFTQAVGAAGKTDSAAIIKAANAWRLGRLGEEGGFYMTYGNVCLRNAPPPPDFTKAYACKYIDGVRKRWTQESATLASLNAKECPRS